MNLIESLFTILVVVIASVLIQFLVSYLATRKRTSKKTKKNEFLVRYPIGYLLLGLLIILLFNVLIGILIWYQGDWQTFDFDSYAMFIPFGLMGLFLVLVSLSVKIVVDDEQIDAKYWFMRNRKISYEEISYVDMVYKLGMWYLHIYKKDSKRPLLKLQMDMENIRLLKKKLVNKNIDIYENPVE